MPGRKTAFGINWFYLYTHAGSQAKISICRFDVFSRLDNHDTRRPSGSCRTLRHTLRQVILNNFVLMAIGTVMRGAWLTALSPPTPHFLRPVSGESYFAGVPWVLAPKISLKSRLRLNIIECINPRLRLGNIIFFRFIFIWVGYTHGGFDTVKEERCGGDIGGNLVSDDARGWWVIGGGSRQIRRGAYAIWFYKYDFRQVAASESYIYLQNWQTPMLTKCKLNILRANFDDMYTIYMDRKLLDDLNKNPNRIKTV